MHHSPFISKIILGLTLLLCSSAVLHSQGIPSGGGGGGSDRIEGKVKFLPIPYVNYDRAIGYSIGALPMLMFNPSQKDTLSPSSVAGAFGMYAENKTWFVMGFTKLFLKEDKWRVAFAGGTGEINYQFHISSPIDIWIPYNAEANFLYIGGERKIIDNLYGGINYIYTSFITSTETLPIADTANLHGFGFTGSYDRRGNVYYPKSGYIANISYKTNPDLFGNAYVSNTIELDANYYYGIRGFKDVIAARFMAGLGIGDLSFNQQFIIGQNDIRGYSQGAYRGNYKIAIQGEYRWNFHKRFGMVGFLGLATIFDGINDSDNGKLLPGGGVGIRVMASEETNFNVGMDVAKGVGDWSLSFMIGEAF